MTEAYVEWLSRLVVLDLGESTRYYEPVSDMIAERLPVSLFYGGMTFFISYFIIIIGTNFISSHINYNNIVIIFYITYHI